mmetsp:Transcript_1807/g.2846  ORF Transcript_1807/g.2846 Transcript_1807/m.2846 type:complete len:519 (-) Transcript_1807:7-1563(-)
MHRPPSRHAVVCLSVCGALGLLCAIVSMSMSLSSMRGHRGDISQQHYQKGGSGRPLKAVSQPPSKPSNSFPKVRPPTYTPVERPPPSWNLTTPFPWLPSSLEELRHEYTEQEWCAMHTAISSRHKVGVGRLCSNKLFRSARLSRESRSVEYKQLDQALKLYPRCEIPAGIPRRKERECVSRSTLDRRGMRHTWAGLPVNSSDTALDLLYYLLGRAGEGAVVNLVFLGDSVSQQLGRFFLCDLIRSGVFPTQSDSAVAKSTLTEFVLPPAVPSSSPSVLRVHCHQFNLPCIYPNSHNSESGCESEQESLAQVQEFVSGLLANYSSSSLAQLPLLHPQSETSTRNHLGQQQHTVAVVNYGLHLKSKHASWAVSGMAQALLNASRALRADNTSLLFRETSAQSFSSSPDGYYHMELANKASPNEFCCNLPLKDPHYSNWRNDLMQRQLAALDPRWESEIGWVPFFNASSALFDLHVEYSPDRYVVDCTHFIYTPTAYSVLWWELKRALGELTSRQKTIIGT